MDKMGKSLPMLGLGLVAVIGTIILVKATRCGHHAGVCEKMGKGIDERLMESKNALEKATDHIQTVFEHIKNRK